MTNGTQPSVGSSRRKYVLISVAAFLGAVVLGVGAIFAYQLWWSGDDEPGVARSSEPEIPPVASPEDGSVVAPVPVQERSPSGPTRIEVAPEGPVGTGGPGGAGPVIDIDEPPPPPRPTPPPVPKTISGGVLNGKAISLPKPVYPAPAKAAHASGAVNVQVTIDETGNVISAIAVSGPVLLRASAVSAARGAKFSPTKLSGTPVKVTGTIIYNFVAQ